MDKLFEARCWRFAALICWNEVVESAPLRSLQEGRFLGDMAKHNGELAEKIFIGSGTREYSATRDHVWDELDQLLLHYTKESVRILEEKGVKQHEGRLAFQVRNHYRGNWAMRFGAASLEEAFAD